jgi:hypothetical protein
MLASNRVECCPERFQMQAATGDFSFDTLPALKGTRFYGEFDKNFVSETC